MNKWGAGLIRIGAGLGLCALVTLVFFTPTPVTQTIIAAPRLALTTPPPSDSQTFPETGHTVRGRFLAYWRGHGGLAQQGYPISEEFTEASALDPGKSYTVQYFERAVFEYHPENAGSPFEVLLTQLGTYRYQAKYGAEGAPNQQASTTNQRRFAETGHTIGGMFRAYWEAHGGLAQQGYPISDEFTEISDLDPGKSYMVQYFERAVFEYHPENAGTPFEVLLAQLGTYRYRGLYLEPTATVTAVATVALEATSTPKPAGPHEYAIAGTPAKVFLNMRKQDGSEVLFADHVARPDGSPGEQVVYAAFLRAAQAQLGIGDMDQYLRAHNYVIDGLRVPVPNPTGGFEHNGHDFHNYAYMLPSAPQTIDLKRGLLLSLFDTDAHFPPSVEPFLSGDTYVKRAFVVADGQWQYLIQAPPQYWMTDDHPVTKSTWGGDIGSRLNMIGQISAFEHDDDRDMALQAVLGRQFYANQSPIGINFSDFSDADRQYALFK